MTKTVYEVVNSPKPKFYKRFAVYIINRRNQPGDFFEKLSSNYPNMKYRVEVKPENLHDTKIVYNNDLITAEVKRNEIKLPVHWSSKVPKRHRRNVIISDLNRATHIASFPADEIPKIKQNVHFPHRFIDSVINNFFEKSEETGDYIIPPDFYDVQKKLS